MVNLIVRIRNAIWLIRKVERLSRGKRRKLTIKKDYITLELIEELHIEISYDSNNLKNIALFSKICNPGYRKNYNVVFYTLDEIENYLSGYNYRRYHQGYIKKYKKKFKLGNSVNKLLESIPLDQTISMEIKEHESYKLKIKVTPNNLDYSNYSNEVVSSTIIFREYNLVDVFCYKGASIILVDCLLRPTPILIAKGVTYEVGINLINQFYTDYLKWKKRTYQEVFSL